MMAPHNRSQHRPTRAVCPSDTTLDGTVGDHAAIRELARRLGRETDSETLMAIHEHLDADLQVIRPARWSHPTRGKLTSTQIMSMGAWGCSAHAQVACHLARAAGIPAILVKTMNKTWLSSENQGDGRGHGHVYVEVLVDERVCLWDAEEGRLHRDYSPSSTEIENRLIYEKGDAGEIILSHHGTEWEEETKRLFPRP